jgi:hypothetical protein
VNFTDMQRPNATPASHQGPRRPQARSKATAVRNQKTLSAPSVAAMWLTVKTTGHRGEEEDGGECGRPAARAGDMEVERGDEDTEQQGSGEAVGPEFAERPAERGQRQGPDDLGERRVVVLQ